MPQLLKHSDEQTLASLVALRRGLLGSEAAGSEAAGSEAAGSKIAGSNLAGTDFSRWGVVSSSRYLGRSPFAAVLDKYKIDGPWGVSVQVIPHRMPHSVPGTVSLALQNHGPSISVGGGPDDQTSTLLSMAGLLCKGRFPGVWLVVSGWWPELTIEIDGQPTSDSKCLAAVLAVVPAPAANSLGSIRFRPVRSESNSPSPDSPSTLADFLLLPGTEPRQWRCQFASGLEVAVELVRPAVRILGLEDCKASAGPSAVPPPHRRPSATGSRVKRGRS